MHACMCMYMYVYLLYSVVKFGVRVWVQRTARLAVLAMQYLLYVCMYLCILAICMYVCILIYACRRVYLCILAICSGRRDARSCSNLGPHKPTPPPPPLFNEFIFGFIKCNNLLNTHETKLVHCNLNLLN